MMLMRKAGAIAVALSVGIVAMMAGGCAKKAAATPEAAFLEFQKAMVFNRRQALEKYAAHHTWPSLKRKQFFLPR